MSIAKNTGSGVVMALLSLVVAGGSAYAVGNGEYCNENDNFGLSHSACVVCMAQGEDAPVCFCKTLLSEGYITTGEEYGACVSSGGVGASKLSFVAFFSLFIGGIAFKLRRRMTSLRLG
jgi:hypothetical protein